MKTNYEMDKIDESSPNEWNVSCHLTTQNVLLKWVSECACVYAIQSDPIRFDPIRFPAIHFVHLFQTRPIDVCVCVRLLFEWLDVNIHIYIEFCCYSTLLA